jgi:hypothetical protein
MIEFSSWDTAFRQGYLHIVTVEYGSGPFFVSYHDPKRSYRINEDRSETTPILIVKILDTKSEELYQLSFETVSGYRVLDEHGLIELWNSDAYDYEKLGRTFMVRGHMWHKESPVTFISGMKGEWSYVVATDDECLEVVSSSEPSVTSLGKLEPHAG